MRFFNEKGAYFLVDGQFGSTGKGLLAAYIAENEGFKIDLFCSSAGPNSGHTHYFGDKKTVLKQLPSAAVYVRQRALALTTGEKWGTNHKPRVYLTAGAVINRDILAEEIFTNSMQGCVEVNPRAAVILPEDIKAEHSGSMAAVAGTRQGVGAAIVRKIQREYNSIISYVDHCDPRFPELPWRLFDYGLTRWDELISFHEVSQGFSLGINSQFYPKVTSRECTVAQACADARVAPQLVKGVAMCVRTYPIRVGNIDGHSSGDWYRDQTEADWAIIGVEPEMTTVTKRVRRVASFSMNQYRQALMANRPTLIFVNFMNYIKTVGYRQLFGSMLLEEAKSVLQYEPKFLWGYGPKIDDISEDIE